MLGDIKKESDGFRGAKWGSSRAEVIALFSKQKLEYECEYTRPCLRFKETISGYPVEIRLNFSNEKFYSASIMLSKSKVAQTKVPTSASDFFRSLLEVTYGEEYNQYDIGDGTYRNWLVGDTQIEMVDKPSLIAIHYVDWKTRNKLNEQYSAEKKRLKNRALENAEGKV